VFLFGLLAHLFRPCSFNSRIPRCGDFTSLLGCNEKPNGHAITRAIRKWAKAKSAHGTDALHTEFILFRRSYIMDNPYKSFNSQRGAVGLFITNDLQGQAPQYFITRFCVRFQNESNDTNIMRNSRHANRPPPAPAKIQSTFMLHPEPNLSLDAPANSSSNAK
jgi:hypothetical protein